MGIMQLMEKIVPEELFSFPQSGSDTERAQYLVDQCFPGATKMQLTSMSGDESEARIPFAQENRALHGLMHGGCFFTVGDTMTAIMCLYHVEDEAERMLTMSASIRYLRPIDQDTVTARARLVERNGKQLNFVCDFLNEAGKRAAQAKFRYMLAKVG